MTKEFPLIQVGEHWYMVDKSYPAGKITTDGTVIYTSSEFRDSLLSSEAHRNHLMSKLSTILASTNPTLDLPLIPAFENNISESEIEQIAADLGYRMLPDDLREGIIAGYKANKAKWADEHMKTMFGLGAANHANGKPSFEEALQSLTKKPVALVVEMVDNGYEVDMEGRGGEDIGWMSVWEPKIWDGYIVIKEVKYE